MPQRILGRHGNGLRTVTKAELIRLLETFDDNQLVAFCFNYGDHSRTVAIDGITQADRREMDETDYSPSGFSVFEPDGDRDEGEARDDDGEPYTVVILS